MANIEVSQYEGDNNWALLIDPDGFITEGTGDNFFIVEGNKIISPEGRNILRGISRDYTKQVTRELGYEYIEKNIEPYDVYCADEAFITGTPFCIMPVTSLNSVPIGTGKFQFYTQFNFQDTCTSFTFASGPSWNLNSSSAFWAFALALLL